MSYGVAPDYGNKAILVKLAGLSEKDLLARLIFGEAMGEMLSGLVAVANVVVNRIKAGGYGRNIREVALAAGQFDCFSESNPHLRLTASPPMREPFTICEMIAELAAKGLLTDNTGGATHYVNLDVCRPLWLGKENMLETCRIGRHTFFKELR